MTARDKPAMFIPPLAPPLTGQESFLHATWKFMRNPIEGFGLLAYSQDITTALTLLLGGMPARLVRRH